MPDALTPRRIENAVFAISDRGYDPGEVEAYLKRVAAHVEALAAGVAEFGVKPYEQFGIEMGDLLQHANDAAEHLRKEAENEAAVILQEADKAARQMRDEAAALKRKTEAEARELRTEAEEIRAEAEDAAKRLADQAEHFRNLAEAETSLQRQDIRKEARRLKDEARSRAEALIKGAQREAAERAQVTERRLRKMQEAEVIMRQRLKTLQSQLRAVVEEAKERGHPIILEKPTTHDEPIEPPNFVRLDSENLDPTE